MDASEQPCVIVGRECPGVATLTLNRPRARNVLSLEMMAALDATLAGQAADHGVRVIVIAAEGPGFCAGHDLREIRAHRDDEDGGRAFNERLFGQAATLMHRIRALDQPVIACVHATAVAAGCELVANCDLAVASTTARFGVNGIDVGLFCSTPGVALARNLPRKRALDLLMTGQLIDATEALELGLVNRVVEPDELHDKTMELAATIAAKPAGAVGLGKRTFYRQLGLETDDAYRVAGEAMVDNLELDDAHEGIDAFAEKRPPSWRRG